MKQPDDILDHVLFNLSPVDPVSIRQAAEGILIMASPGAGKTANVGKTVAYSLLRTPGSGGLVLTAKGTEVDTFRRYARACSREQDFIYFSADSGHAFDPIYYLWNAGRGARDLETIVEFFDTLLSIGRQHVGVSTDRFWELSVAALIRSVLILLSLAGKAISIISIHEVIESLPQSPEQADDENWGKTAKCSVLLTEIKKRRSTLKETEWKDLDYASEFLLERWPNFDVKPRSSVEFTWVGMAHKFLFGKLRDCFSSGRCTFAPEMAAIQGKWIVVDFPMLQYGIETGRFINILLKECFSRGWLRRDLRQSRTLLVLWQDEFQAFLSPKSIDLLFAQTARESIITNVCLTQNILGVAEALGEPEPGSKTKGYLGNLANHFYLQQNEVTSATYASEKIGKHYRYLENFNASSTQFEQQQQASVGGSQQLVYKVEPSEFSRLIKPDNTQPCAEAIVYQGGKHFNATKTPRNPEGTNYLRVAFSRDIEGAKS